MNLTPEARAELRRRADDIRALVEELDKADDFKTFVHGYLDAHGVPHGDPDNIHQKEGCRIGARLDLLFARLDAAEKREAATTAAKKAVADYAAVMCRNHQRSAADWVYLESLLKVAYGK